MNDCVCVGAGETCSDFMMKNEEFFLSHFHYMYVDLVMMDNNDQDDDYRSNFKIKIDW